VNSNEKTSQQGKREIEMKRVKLISLLIVMIFAFAVPVFAQTSLEDVQAKLKNAKSAGVTTLADVQKELRLAGNERELARINGIKHTFGTSELSILKLPKGGTIGEVAKVISAKNFSGIGAMVRANGLTMAQCNKLPAGFIFYIPTSMIRKGLVLDPYEVAMLKQQYAAAKVAVSRLTEEVGELKEVVVLQKDEIAGLQKDLTEEKTSHAETKQILAKTEVTLNKTSTEAQELKGSFSSLQKQFAIGGGLVLAFMVGLVLYVFLKGIRESRKQKIATKAAEMRASRQAGEDSRDSFLGGCSMA
jgi:hypothetical protein